MRLHECAVPQIRNNASLAKTIDQLRDLEKLYGSELFQTSLKQLHEEKKQTIESLSQILRRQSEENLTDPVIPLRLPNKPEIANLQLKPDNLDQYDNN